MEDKFFIKRLNLFIKLYCCFDQFDEDISTVDEAVHLYKNKISELLRFSNILDKIFVLLDETDIYLEFFYEKDWEKGNDPNTNNYGVQSYQTLRSAANKFQDNIDFLTEKVFFLLKFYLKYAPDQIRSKCDLPKVLDEELIDYLCCKINVMDIGRKVNENTCLSECIKDDASLFGDYLCKITKEISQ
ncbi:MAG: hypothetical protein AAGU27_08800 [Dehalobacterium sp.]